MKQKKIFNSVNRQGTYTTKYDDAIKKFGTNDVMPLWVADMDLASPQCVQHTLAKRAAHPVYGYTVYPPEYFDAIQAWQKKRFNWQIEKEWIVPCYGVVPSMNFAITAFSDESDSVIIQTPIYPPFGSSVKAKKRNVLDNTLVYKNGSYSIDFKDFEEKAKEAKLFLLCSPHNPSGRAWSKEELEKIIDICVEEDVFIIADEIHADVVYEKMHHSVGTFEKMMDRCVILNAPSKTFNIAGLNTSFAIIKDRTLRECYVREQNKSGITNGNPFGIEALISAYNEGDEWLDALKVHLSENIVFVKTFLQTHHIPINPVDTEATFLMWLDCKKLNLSQEALIHFFIHDARLGLNDGKSFGEAGEGFMRLNIGTSREVLEEAMLRLLHAYKEKM